MRWILVVLLAALLGGCSAPAEVPEAEEEVPDDGPSRVARGQSGVPEDEDGEEVETQPVELLRTPLRMAGQGPESFEFTMPANVAQVDFAFTGSPTVEVSDLRIEIDGCGAFHSGTGVWGTTGGDFTGTVCTAATEGPTKVTLAATLVVVDGTFILTGHQPVA